MMSVISKRVAELKSVSCLPMKDKQIAKSPHIEEIVGSRVYEYTFHDKRLLVNPNTEICFSLPYIHIKSLKAKRILYNRDSERVPVEDFISKGYIQPFFFFINDQFIPWKYLQIFCMTEKNYVIFRATDEQSAKFIRQNRTKSLTSNTIYLPDSFKYKEIKSADQIPKNFVMGFDDNWKYCTRENSKYIVYNKNPDVEVTSGYYDTNNSLIKISDELGRSYSDECCLTFKDGLLDRSTSVEFIGNILKFNTYNPTNYVLFFNKRSGRSLDHAAKMQVDTLLEIINRKNNPIFGDLIKNKFDISMNRNSSYFYNVKAVAKKAIKYDSRDLLDEVYKETCGIDNVEITGKEMKKYSIDGFFNISKFHNVSIDDRIIVLRNGILYGFKSHDLEDQSDITRWRQIYRPDELEPNKYDNWHELMDSPSEYTDDEYTDVWLTAADIINNSIGASLDSTTDQWNTLGEQRDIQFSPEEGPTDNWYSPNVDDKTREADNWRGITYTPPELYKEIEVYKDFTTKYWDFRIPLIDVQDDDIIEFMIFKHVNNSTYDVIVNENSNYNELSEDVYNHASNIFCRETSDRYFEYPENGVQHFPIKFSIEHKDNDPYKKRIRYDDSFYYGKEVTIASKKRFVHRRYTLTQTQVDNGYIDFGTDFMYCNKYENYLIFLDGKRVSNDQFRMTLPVKTTTPFCWFYLYLTPSLRAGDIVDIFYLPTIMQDIYNGDFNHRGLVKVPKENINYPLNNKSYMYWVNGVKVPQSKIKTIDSTRAQIITNMNSICNLAVTQICNSTSEEWLTASFKDTDSEWDQLLRSLSMKDTYDLLDISPVDQEDIIIPVLGTTLKNVLIKVITMWYKNNNHVDTTDKFVYDYDNTYDIIHDFDFGSNSVIYSNLEDTIEEIYIGDVLPDKGNQGTLYVDTLHDEMSIWTISDYMPVANTTSEISEDDIRMLFY